MPCFSMSDIKSASVRSCGGLVCPSTISIAVGWNVVSGLYNGITCAKKKKKKRHTKTELNMFSYKMCYALSSNHLIVPLVIRVHFQIIACNDRQSTSRESLFSYFNFNRHLLTLSIFGATGQEVTYNELIQPLFITLQKKEK